MAHLAAVRAHGDALPVTLVVFVEGEEEIGSESLPATLAAHGEKLRADAIVLADSTNWAIGEPALTVTLRGLIRVVVTVRTLSHGIHSGMFGGAVPDALTALIRLLASLHMDDGEVAVAGLLSGTASDLPYDEPRLRAESGLLDAVAPIGRSSPGPAVGQAVDHDDRDRRPHRRDRVQHPRPRGECEDLDADRARAGPGRGIRPRAHPPDDPCPLGGPRRGDAGRLGRGLRGGGVRADV